jgi:N-acetylated-alpha-linked acidic dipeptidase
MRDSKAGTPPFDSALVETRIGSGSDHTVFLNHLGRPVINLGFDGDYGVYHSMYDDHYWMSHIGDPAFEYHVALTRIWGLVALRLANSDILPFDFGFNASALEQFLRELEHKNKIDSRLRLKRLHVRIAGFERAGNLLRDTVARDMLSGVASPEKIQRLNERLLQVESNWLDPAGIPGRPWFQHLLYSSRYTYAHLEFPGLTEAVEKHDWKLAGQQAALLEKAVEKNTKLLRSAQSSWEKNKP